MPLLTYLGGSGRARYPIDGVGAMNIIHVGVRRRKDGQVVRERVYHK